MTGYSHPDYARSLTEFGRPVRLPRSGGSVLERQVPGREDFDAMGPYPLFACRDWSRLPEDLAAVDRAWVTLVLVADPFGGYTPELLRDCFNLTRPFKQHFVTDLSRPLDSIASEHHRRNAERGLRELRVEVTTEPERWLDDWDRLYHVLVERHEIMGLRRFSRESFLRQLEVPGVVAFRAIRDTTERRERGDSSELVPGQATRGLGVSPNKPSSGAGGLAPMPNRGPGSPLGERLTLGAGFSETEGAEAETVGMLLWYRTDDVGYYHLGAFSREGYQRRASHALFWRALDYFAASGLRWLDLGAGAGVSGRTDDGLSRFKQGWSTETRPTYLCGRVFDPARLHRLCPSPSVSLAEYFPPYRKGEFV